MSIYRGSGFDPKHPGGFTTICNPTDGGLVLSLVSMGCCMHEVHMNSHKYAQHPHTSETVLFQVLKCFASKFFSIATWILQALVKYAITVTTEFLKPEHLQSE